MHSFFEVLGRAQWYFLQREVRERKKKSPIPLRIMWQLNEPGSDFSLMCRVLVDCSFLLFIMRVGCMCVPLMTTK